jgi:hypothetical protein
MDDKHKTIIFTMIGMGVVTLLMLYSFSTSIIFMSASRSDPYNINYPLFPDLLPSQKTYEQNETYLKYTFDGLVNSDQSSVNRGVDFSKCYDKNNQELFNAIASDTHYIKIRGNNPDEVLKTISLPSIMLKAGFAIPDPSKLYISKFKQVSPDEYKLWIITKTPVTKTIDGALENTCQIDYYY